MKKIVILVGSYCNNRGSEALVNGTIEIIKRYCPDSKIVLSSGENEFGPHLKIKNVDTYVKRISYPRRSSLKRIVQFVLRKVLRKTRLADKIRYKDLLTECADADLIIISGADNYDKNYHAFDKMHDVNAAIRRVTRGKMVMFDCSLHEGDIDSRIKDDFTLFDAVTAREMDTYRAFKRTMSGYPLYYFPDPAFVMPPIETPLPEGLVPHNTIGVNLSTMVLDPIYGGDKEVIIESYQKTIDWILKNTEHQVLLLPHVMNHLDLDALQILYKPFKGQARVYLLEDESLCAGQLKSIISKLVFFIGARTHSTIAAYSTCVPALAVSYSVKSVGIARDLFGQYEGYVVPVQELKKADILKDTFCMLYQRREELHALLESRMKQYIPAVWSTGELFADLLQQ